MRYKIATKTTLTLLVVAFFAPISALADEETIPIPPRRPDVLNVSPAYIKQLISENEPAAAHENDVALSVDEAISEEFEFDEEPLDDIVDSEQPIDGDISHILFDEENEVSTVEDVDSKMVLAALQEELYNNDGSDLDVVPIPQKKPTTATVETRKEQDGRALISFALSPEQIDLDPMLEEFLSEYAIDMFRNDPKLKMEIFAYATPEDNKDFSDVRRALARALEVRRYLLSQNIEASRLKINAVGQDEGNKTNNRIDLIFNVSD